MPNLTTNTNTIHVTVYEVGQGKRFLELPEGSLGDALLEACGGAGKRVTAGGVEVTSDTPLADNMTATVGPKAVKQGS